MKKLSNILDRYNISTQLSTDVLWNIASFGIIAFAGLLLNFIVAFYYSVTVLGVFNQVYALYIFLSQLAVGGVHLSVLKTVAQAHDDNAEVKKIFTSGFLLTLVTSFFISVITFLVGDIFGRALGSQDVSVGVVYIVPGLLFFSLNKTMLALLNGLRQMKAYAVFQALRFVFMLIFFVILAHLGTPGNALPAIFSLAEGLLFLLLLMKTFKFVDLFQFLSYKDLYYYHAVFGLKAAGGNLLLDINTRVDVIVLGLFSSDHIVGIYSFAALVVEGFSQLPVVLRANVNPLVTQTYYYESREAFEKLLTRIRNLSYYALVPIGTVITLGFPIIFLIKPDPDIMASWSPLIILMVGTMLSIGYLPLLMIFNQTGHPASQTFLILIIFLSNLALNLILVPFFGLIGSAIGTGATFTLQILYIRWLSIRTIGIKI